VLRLRRFIQAFPGCQRRESTDALPVDEVDLEVATLEQAALEIARLVEEFDPRSGQRVRSVKNQNSVRKVPLRQLPIDMELLDFVDHVRTPELFPELTGKADGWGGLIFVPYRSCTAWRWTTRPRSSGT
jgi:hypothetical protein